MSRYFDGKFLEIPVATPDCFAVSTNCTIRGFEEENWLTSFHCHWHQASIMFEQRKTIRIVCHSGGRASLFIQYSVTINIRDAVHPAFICLNGAAIEYAMLHDNVADGLHCAFWHRQIVRCFFEKLGPDVTPLAKSWPQVLETLQREEVRRERQADLIGSNKC